MRFVIYLGVLIAFVLISSQWTAKASTERHRPETRLANISRPLSPIPPKPCIIYRETSIRWIVTDDEGNRKLAGETIFKRECVR